MGFREILSKYFNNHSETLERHWDPELRSRYYKTTKDRGFETVAQFFKHMPKAEVLALSPERGELTVNYKGKRRAFVVATVIMVKPHRTSIDFSVTTEGGLLDLGFSHNLIKKFYEGIDKELQSLDR